LFHRYKLESVACSTGHRWRRWRRWRSSAHSCNAHGHDNKTPLSTSYVCYFPHRKFRRRTSKINTYVEYTCC